MFGMYQYKRLEINCNGDHYTGVLIKDPGRGWSTRTFHLFIEQGKHKGQVRTFSIPSEMVKDCVSVCSNQDGAFDVVFKYERAQDMKQYEMENQFFDFVRNRNIKLNDTIQYQVKKYNKIQPKVYTLVVNKIDMEKSRLHGHIDGSSRSGWIDPLHKNIVIV